LNVGNDGKRSGTLDERNRENMFKEGGIRTGQILLDFGCGSGNYTITAAEIVVKTGKCYALDKEKRGF